MPTGSTPRHRQDRAGGDRRLPSRAVRRRQLRRRQAGRAAREPPAPARRQRGGGVDAPARHRPGPRRRWHDRKARQPLAAHPPEAARRPLARGLGGSTWTPARTGRTGRCAAVVATAEPMCLRLPGEPAAPPRQAAAIYTGRPSARRAIRGTPAPAGKATGVCSDASMT